MVKPLFDAKDPPKFAPYFQKPFPTPSALENMINIASPEICFVPLSSFQTFEKIAFKDLDLSLSTY